MICVLNVTSESIKNTIKDNKFNVEDLFTDEQILEYVRGRFRVEEVFAYDEIMEYARKEIE